MEARGYPTSRGEWQGEHPRFKERLPEEFRRSDVNPFLVEHRNFGPPLYPASEAWKFRGRWEECFGRTAPLHAEIGSGNGFYLAGFAQRHPDINLVGVEIRYKRTVLCAKKIQEAQLHNARIVRYNGWYLDDLFLPGSLQGLHVNHPDPWPKAKHEKNRLISRWFLELASALLTPGGTLRIKSDYQPNVDRVFDLMAAGDDGLPRPALPLSVAAHSQDIIQHGAIWDDDIETNYQSKFRKRGLPVAAIELARTSGSEFTDSRFQSKHGNDPL